METQKSVTKRQKHGHRSFRTPTYNSWRKMKERCTNPNQQGYEYYGGIGISIYVPWLEFKNFLADMGERPENKTIDRINPDMGYSPANCRWATRSQQARNKRKK